MNGRPGGASPPALPDAAYAAVRCHNQWVWIDDHDDASKHIPSFLMLTFPLTEEASSPAAPVVTVPAC